MFRFIIQKKKWKKKEVDSKNAFTLMRFFRRYSANTKRGVKVPENIFENLEKSL